MLKIVKTFWRFIRIRKYWYFLFVFLVILHTVLSFAGPYFYKLFIERIQANQLDGFIYLLLAYLGVRVFTNLVSNMRYFSGDKAVVDAVIAARLAVFRAIQDLDFAYHTSKSTGALISIMKRGNDAFWNLYDRIHEQFVTVIVGFIVLGFYMATIDTRIIGVFVVSIIVTILIIRFIMTINIRRRLIFNEVDDEVSAIITDNLINYETVKLFSKEKREHDRLADKFKDWKEKIWSYFFTFRYIDTSLGNLINVCVFLILLISTNLVSDRSIGISDFVLITTAVSTFFPKLFDVVYNMKNIFQGYADIQKFFGILDLEIQVKDPLEEVKVETVTGAIEFKNMSFSYKEGKSRAVKNIDLKIKPGESVALVGRSGVGKTTLVRLLMRFFDVDEGEIIIDGVNIKNFTKSRLRSFIGVVPQEPILFNNTIGYNIAYGSDRHNQEEIAAAAKLANLDKFISGLSQKYDTHVGERGIKLSGGQKQRLAIARMILSNPDIVIFDEATSQLDSESEKLIQEAFWKAVKDKTTIVIAHRLSTIVRCDKIVVMEKGKIVEVGTHKELLSQDSLYKRFWDLQINKEDKNELMSN